jgi:hypothetical protein
MDDWHAMPKKLESLVQTAPVAGRDDGRLAIVGLTDVDLCKAQTVIDRGADDDHEPKT